MNTEIKDQLWAAYKRDGNRKWLETMLYLGLFKDAAMGEEISEAFKIFHTGKDHLSRDNSICELYGMLHPEFSGQFRKKDIRDVQRSFPEMNYETIRSVLRSKFDIKKHIKT